ncbi:MAG: HlyD family efflux transporter periplasmic adaptor subunit [Rhodocyclaceae bacterium]|nr:HlyD family efflux transporter periplasmic adaptor subunit [Rhodocyclaceae bacterium]MCA6468554.1 HlyD family efflux transporter periplasmic adaptor subunit [Chitinophagaceae bacterium]MCA3047076.1 HlyD family efflux transporter periplasmic adaptor subunit [Rhodocyclaceae bacterium]MCA3049820.1 HlyD family efflux transporter periplasmic adaptor subunit [Rhodocyclaceae bacterium]MCA3054236.1 HlyD family efflux transporter periplasmic adaptor subunit [Rhodocyclaceae bacterium]
MPITLTVLSMCSLASAIAVAVFLCVGEYSKRVKAVGLVTPSEGAIRVVAPTQGIVEQRLVAEGQTVQKGQVLFVLSNERTFSRDSRSLEAGAATLATIKQRISSVDLEMALASQFSRRQREMLSKKVNYLKAEIAQIDAELRTLTDRLQSSEDQYKYYKDLVDQRFYSERVLQQKKDETLDQKSRLLAMRRAKIALERDLEATSDEFSQAQLKSDREYAVLARSKAELRSGEIATEAQRTISVVAPVSGIATSVMVGAGDQIGIQTMLAIVPENSTLEAHLFIPSKGINGVHVSQPVSLRVSNLPYQKYGTQSGKIKSVSMVGLAISELPPAISQALTQEKSEFYFKVVAEIVTPPDAPGNQKARLVAGATVEADVLQETKTLIGWLLNPFVEASKQVKSANAGRAS